MASRVFVGTSPSVMGIRARLSAYKSISGYSPTYKDALVLLEERTQVIYVDASIGSNEGRNEFIDAVIRLRLTDKIRISCSRPEDQKEWKDRGLTNFWGDDFLRSMANRG